MITIMRKHHKVLMIFITVLVCISFSWHWNKTDFGQLGNGTVGKIYDRNVSEVEFQRNARLLRLGSQLGMRELITELTAGAQSESASVREFFLEPDWCCATKRSDWASDQTRPRSPTRSKLCPLSVANTDSIWRATPISPTTRSRRWGLARPRSRSWRRIKLSLNG